MIEEERLETEMQKYLQKSSSKGASDSNLADDDEI